MLWIYYLPVLVIIISVPNSWKRSQSSFVSKWHWTGFRSSQLQEPTIFGAFGAGSGVRRSPSASLLGDCGGVVRPTLPAPLLLLWLLALLALLLLLILLLLLLLRFLWLGLLFNCSCNCVWGGKFWLALHGVELMFAHKRRVFEGGSSESLQSTTSTSTSSSIEIGPEKYLETIIIIEGKSNELVEMN